MYCPICCAERTQGDNFVSRQLFCCHSGDRSPSMNLHRLPLWTAIFTMLRPHVSSHFLEPKGCRDRDKKNRIPWVQGRGTQPDSSAWKVHSSFLTEIQLCVAFERVAFLIVDFSFHGQGQLLQVRRQPRSSDGFVYLGIHHSSLANCTGASIANVVARYQNSSSKLCLSFDQFQPRSLQQTRLHKKYNFGTATSYHCVKPS